MRFPAEFVWAVVNDSGMNLWGYCEKEEDAERIAQLGEGRSVRQYVLTDETEATMKKCPGTWVDPEIDALGAVLNALSPIDKPARDRVVNWVMHRLDEEKGAEVQPADSIDFKCYVATAMHAAGIDQGATDLHKKALRQMFKEGVGVVAAGARIKKAAQALEER